MQTTLKRSPLPLVLMLLGGLICAVPAEAGSKHHHYKLVDLGTFGGPHSYGSVNGEGFPLLNNSGVVVSYADLSSADPNAAFGCYVPDCSQAHAAMWKDGRITDLGTLPGNNNSAAGSINARGWATGQSQTSTIDPVLGSPEFRGVLWKDGQIIDLGTLEAGTESLGIYVNDGGQVIGFATINTESDLVGFLGFPTHTFIWEHGDKLDIGTLGGVDALPGASCSHAPEGVVAGGSTTTTVSNPDTGVPTVAPFLWRHGRMLNLGTLGGTVGFAQCVNSRGQVVGVSSNSDHPGACLPTVIFGSPGDPGCHAFFWQDGVMSDLGTLGGEVSETIWLNDDGDLVVGSADLPGGQIHHAVLWKKGKLHDLGTVSGDPCSRGGGLNARGQVIGGSSDCSHFLHAFLWEDGGPIVDLNTLIPAGSGVQLRLAYNINDRGEILADSAPIGFTPADAELGHQVLLIPCDEQHPGLEGCDYNEP
jgi:probable HAF family extracellular repeat protein